MQLADGGLDAGGVLTVGVQGGLELRQTAAGVAGGGVDLRRASGPGQTGVRLQRGVAVARGVLGQLQSFPLGLRLLLGLLNHFHQGLGLLLPLGEEGGEAALFVLFHRRGGLRLRFHRGFPGRGLLGGGMGRALDGNIFHRQSLLLRAVSSLLLLISAERDVQ